MHRSQVLLIPSLLALCWLGMQVVHEAGHVVGTVLTGGTVVRVVLHPLAISRTDVSPNPSPRFVVWSGPILGILLPVIGWLAASAGRMKWAYLSRFFAGFCLVANGLYIGIGAFHPVGDAADLLTHCVPHWQLAAFGLTCTPLGFLLWNGQGKHFGLTPGSSPPPLSHAASVMLLLLIVGGLELTLSSR